MSWLKTRLPLPDTVRKRVPEIKDRDNLNGFLKIGFLVSHVDGLAAELKRRGTTFVSEPSDDRAFGVRQFLVEDNAGNLLQFFQTLSEATPAMRT